MDRFAGRFPGRAAWQPLCQPAGMAGASERRQRTIQLQERVFAFSCGVVMACPRQPHDMPSRETWRQLVRAAMGASSNLEEADEASSPADFVHKMKIALREVKEAARWLRLVRECRLDAHQHVLTLEREAGELSAIFATIVVKVKRRLAANAQASSGAARGR